MHCSTPSSKARKNATYHIWIPFHVPRQFSYACSAGPLQAVHAHCPCSADTLTTAAILKLPKTLNLALLPIATTATVTPLAVVESTLNAAAAVVFMAEYETSTSLLAQLEYDTCTSLLAQLTI